MRSYIKVNNALRKELQTKFRCTRRSVYNALAFITNGENPANIRRYALDHGGVYEEQNFIPNCKTEREGSLIHQTFPCGVKVIVNTSDNTAVLLQPKLEDEKFSDVTMQSWSGILAKAQDISDRAIASKVARQ